MSAVLICRTAEEDAIVGALAMARSFNDSGDDVIVVIAGGALAAMDDGTFQWSHNFRTRDQRARVIRGAESTGLELADRLRDPRWSDVRTLLEREGTRGGITIVACPGSMALLGLDAPPEPLAAIDQTALVAALKGADVVMGGF